MRGRGHKPHPPNLPPPATTHPKRQVPRGTPMNFLDTQPWLLIPFIIITVELWATLKAKLARRFRQDHQ